MNILVALYALDKNVQFVAVVRALGRAPQTVDFTQGDRMVVFIADGANVHVSLLELGHRRGVDSVVLGVSSEELHENDLAAEIDRADRT